MAEYFWRGDKIKPVDVPCILNSVFPSDRADPQIIFDAAAFSGGPRGWEGNRRLGWSAAKWVALPTGLYTLGAVALQKWTLRRGFVTVGLVPAAVGLLVFGGGHHWDRKQRDDAGKGQLLRHLAALARIYDKQKNLVKGHLRLHGYLKEDGYDAGRVLDHARKLVAHVHTFMPDENVVSLLEQVYQPVLPADSEALIERWFQPI